MAGKCWRRPYRTERGNEFARFNEACIRRSPCHRRHLVVHHAVASIAGATMTRISLLDLQQLNHSDPLQQILAAYFLWLESERQEKAHAAIAKLAEEQVAKARAAGMTNETMRDAERKLERMAAAEREARTGERE